MQNNKMRMLSITITSDFEREEEKKIKKIGNSDRFNHTYVPMFGRL